MTGWWFQPTPLKNHGVSNSWDDEIPNMKKYTVKCSKPPTITNQCMSQMELNKKGWYDLHAENQVLI